MEERTHKKKDCTVHAVQLGGCQLGAVQLGGVLADKGKLGVTLLLLLLLLQLEVEGEEADSEVDLKEEDGHSDPHRGQEDRALAHLHLLLLVVIRHGFSDIAVISVSSDRDVSVIFPGGVVDNDVDDAGDGVEEVEDGKDEHQADFLQASAADAQQS